VRGGGLREQLDEINATNREYARETERIKTPHERPRARKKRNAIWTERSREKTKGGSE
jgi:hypothetical protein